MMTSEPLTLQPIGYISTGRKLKFEAPHQPDSKAAERSVIELVPGNNFERALSDLSGFSHIWLIWWFHKNAGWRPMVLPPRGGARRRGVFSTRSPHRPNPLGLTAVPLIAVQGRNLIVGANDLLDGTPILDIKPYLPRIDSWPDAASGWVSEVEQELAGAPRFAIEIREPAAHQLEWLRLTWRINFLDRAKEILERDPTPHRTRRITRAGEDFRMGCGAWRLYFRCERATVMILRIAPGYPRRLLESPDAAIADREAQRAFGERWQTDD